MDELGLTEVELEKLRRQLKLNGAIQDATPHQEAPAVAPEKPTRKRRANAGIPRPPKPAAAPQGIVEAPGGITQEQAQELERLCDVKFEARMRSYQADAEADEADMAVAAYLASITQK